MGYNLKNLKTYVNTGSGIAEFALLAPKAYFTTNGIKSPVAPFNTPGDSISIKTAHEFLPGKGFLYFQLAPQKNEHKIGFGGDLGLGKQNQELTFFVPGSYEDLHATIKDLVNTPLIAIVKDSNCEADMYFQLGCDCQFAWIQPEFTTGTTNNGVKGYNVKAVYDGGPLIYKVAGGPEIMPDVVAGAPQITSQPVGGQVNTGSTLALAVGAAGAALTYQWKKGGVNIAGATAYQYQKANVASGDAGSYTCVVTNASGFVETQAAIVTVV